MRKLFAFFIAAGTFALSAQARADILINIDKSTQRMTVSKDGQMLYNWAVSTGKTGHATPSGKFQAFRMERDHFSKEWDDAPMPYSIFFTKVGHAIHGTYSKNIGLPVSHGCVRLSVAHAEKLFHMVQQEGVLKTKVVLTGSEQIALKHNRTRVAEQEENAEPQQSQNRRLRERDSYSYGRPQYDPRYREPQYADRYGRPQGYGYDYYGDRYYRPQPRYIQPQYPDQDPYRGRHGIY
ncbi:MAG TPA: L,D-transpeptidase [Xanthobacteraceae bacterium]|nr:L,D-transpeptidase [Xanthobacteraceae bacterium]